MKKLLIVMLCLLALAPTAHAVKCDDLPQGVASLLPGQSCIVEETDTGWVCGQTCVPLGGGGQGQGEWHEFCPIRHMGGVPCYITYTANGNYGHIPGAPNSKTRIVRTTTALRTVRNNDAEFTFSFTAGCLVSNCSTPNP